MRPITRALARTLGSTFVTLDHIVLRDACNCPRCIDPSTRQKLFQTQDIPIDIHPQNVTANPEDDSIAITWSTDFMETAHVSHYSNHLLRCLTNFRTSVRARNDDLSYVLWDKAVMETDVQFIPYKDYMENEEILLFTLQQLVVYGLVFLKDVPKDEESVARMAERVGYIQQSFYGRTWDVRSMANSKNIAYTSLNLGLHMDLLYYASPPTLQFLHCLENTVTGGSSYFVDSFRATELVRINSPNAFKSLTTFPINFHYKNDSQHYHYTRPMVVLQENTYLTRKRIDHVNYSPPFQAPFDVPNDADERGAASKWRQLFHALVIFGNIIKKEENQFELRLKEGECVIFKNRRVLHARRDYDVESGDRWLKGAYVGGDAYRSKLRVLLEKFRKKPDMLGTDLEYSYIH
ncbi:hypothetical protein BGX38DRAFT_1249058 [Terfezia claveryi]|nr:hypothetical protein BGX38DRAFT_1249058 [Terfezia claveryi]